MLVPPEAGLARCCLKASYALRPDRDLLPWISVQATGSRGSRGLGLLAGLSPLPLLTPDMPLGALTFWTITQASSRIRKEA